MQIIKNEDGKDVRINASSYACVMYESTFGNDLAADWGDVELSVRQYVEAQETLSKTNELFENACIDIGVDPSSPEALDELGEEKGKLLEVIMATFNESKINASKNCDLQMTKFMQILFVLDMAQRRKDNEKETTFEKWLIENDIRLFKVWEQVVEEMQKVFS